MRRARARPGPSNRAVVFHYGWWLADDDKKPTNARRGAGPARSRRASGGGDPAAEHALERQGSTLLPGPVRAQVAQATSSTNYMTIVTTCGHAFAAGPRARRATTPASTTSPSKASSARCPPKDRCFCDRVRPLVFVLGTNDVYRAPTICGDMRSREEERGARAAPCPATGARPARGGPWATSFRSMIERLARSVWINFGPMKTNGSAAREPCAAWAWEMVLWATRELRNSFIRSSPPTFSSSELAEHPPAQLHEHLDLVRENPAAPRPCCAATPHNTARTRSRDIRAWLWFYFTRVRVS